MAISKINSPDSLSPSRAAVGATNIDKYAIFAGGGGNSTIVEAYDKSLTKTFLNELGIGLVGLAASHSNVVALFSAGRNSSSYYGLVTTTAYVDSIKLPSCDGLGLARSYAGATHIGDYILFGGGSNKNGTVKNVDAYNAKSLTKATVDTLVRNKQNAAATHVGDYAIFAGGNANNTYQDFYNTSLTHTYTNVYGIQTNSVSTHVGNYALFGGGSSMLFYDSSLTISSSIDGLSVSRTKPCGVNLNKCALFAGGNVSGTSSDVVDVYDTSLTHSIATSLSKGRSELSSAHIGNIALFTGSADGPSGYVDAYKSSSGLNVKQIYKGFIQVIDTQ